MGHVGRKVGWHRAVFFPAAFALFLPSFRTPAMLDDFVYFLWFDSTRWRHVASLLDPRNGYIWIRPVATFLYYLEYQFTQETMIGYRLAGIFWHAAIAVTVTVWVRRSLRQTDSTAIAAGWLFLVHPAAVQAVCYPSARGEQLFLLTGLWSLILFSDAATGRAGMRRAVIAGGGLLVLSLLSKETAVGWAVILGLFLWIERPGLPTSNPIRIPCMTAGFITGAYLVGRTTVMSGIGGYGWMSRSGLPPLRLAGESILWMIHVLPRAHFFPVSPGLHGIAPWMETLTTALTIGIICLAMLRPNQWRFGIVSLGFLAVSQALVTAVFAGSDPDILAPRYLYMGSVAVASVLAGLLVSANSADGGQPDTGNRWRRISVRLMLVILVVAWTHAQIRFQRDFRHAGEITGAVLTLTEQLCNHLQSGGEIDIYHVPERAGAFTIHIPSRTLSIFNLAGHRNCGLAVQFNMAAGQDPEHWFRYMDDLPGRIGVTNKKPPNSALRSESTAIVPLVIDFAEMYPEFVDSENH
ncbi:hypothetical protein JXA80_14635 [bacterium]|nr:hypothetical protein [candidate division CSSED10-310 bacterium]